jgi:hypothetical protein
MTQLSLGGLGGIVLAPDVLEEQRGAWCSPPEWCERATERGPFDVDPFTNPRSTLRARHKCMLERGDDGFGLDRKDVAGTYYINPEQCEFRGEESHHYGCMWCGYHVADAETTVWFQPPYDIVLQALAHFGHTRYVALLRLDTSTVWFADLWLRSEVIMVPKRDRLEFVPPPGVKASSNPFPHGLFYKRAEDVPDGVREHCYAWPCPSYPWDVDPLKLRPTISARWRLFEHKIVLGQKLGRPIMVLHLSRIVGAGTEDAAACGSPSAVIAPCDQMRGYALACCECLKISELATVTPLR